MLRTRYSMAVFSALAFIPGVFASRGAAAETSLSGRWKLSYKVEEQSKDYDLDLKQEGSKVTGSLTSPRSGRKDDLSSGSFEGGKLKFEVSRQNNEKFVVEATAKSDSRLEGTIAIGEHTGIPLVLTRAMRGAIAGKWNVISKTADGQEYNSTLELNEEGGGLKGKQVTTLGTIEIGGAKFDGEKLSYEIVLPIDGNNVAFLVSASLVEANKLSGRWKTRDADFSGEWLASRDAPAVAAAAPKAAAAPPAPALAPAARVVAGKWFGVAATPKDGKKSVQLELAADGSKLTGKIHTPHGVSEIQDGKASDRKLEFSFTLKADGKDVLVKVEAEIDAHDMLKGKWTGPDGETGEISGRKPVNL